MDREISRSIDRSALQDSERGGLDSSIIYSFLRDNPISTETAVTGYAMQSLLYMYIRYVRAP